MQRTDRNSRDFILDQICRLFETGGWTQGAFARDDNGVACEPEHNGAVCFDLRGAIVLCSHKYGGSLAQKKVERALAWSLDKRTQKQTLTDFVTPENFAYLITKWQDAPQRTKMEVLNLVKLAKEAP